MVWRSWEPAARSAAAAEQKEPLAGAPPNNKKNERRRDTKKEPQQCAYGSVLDKTFIMKCAPLTAEDPPPASGEGSLLQDECPLFSVNLAEAVSLCSGGVYIYIYNR